MSKTTSKFIGGSNLQKELQGFAAFVAYQECHRKGDSATKATLEASVGTLFFGEPNNPDSIGLADQLVHGIGVFGGLYDIVEDVGTHPLVGGIFHDATTIPQHAIGSGRVTPTTHPMSSTSSLAGTGRVLVMKNELHCLGEHVKICAGKPSGVTLALMIGRNLKTSATNIDAAGERVTNRTLYNRVAQDVMRNGKKALSIVMAPNSPYKDFVKTGNLPSGMVHKDYLLYIRREMYKLLVSSAGDTMVLDESSATAADINENSGNDCMPAVWYFPGYIVFALLGPVVLPNMLSYRSELLMTTAENTAGRQKQRGQKLPCTSLAISEPGPSSFLSRSQCQNQALLSKQEDSADKKQLTAASAAGISFSQQIQLYSLVQSRAVQDERMKSRHHDRIVSMHQ